jgi:hypothetical protein
MGLSRGKSLCDEENTIIAEKCRDGGKYLWKRSD